MAAPRRRGSGGLQLRNVTQTRPEQLAEAHHERVLDGALTVAIEQVQPDTAQPRRDWTHDDGERRLVELASSIREFGILQPLLVREDGVLSDGRPRYVIIAGGRRHAAAEQAGFTALPVVVRGEEGARVRVLQLLENLQRQGLSPLDEARAYQELLDAEDLTPPALAARLHLSAQQIRDRLRLLADQVLADAVERDQLSASAAREIVKLPPDEVLRFRERVAAGERVQTKDVFVARQRLQAQGIVNPRLDRRRAPSADPRPASDGGQTSFASPLPVEGRPATGDTPAAHPSGAPPEPPPRRTPLAPPEDARPESAVAPTRSLDPDAGGHPAALAAVARHLGGLVGAALGAPVRERVAAELLDLERTGDLASWLPALYEGLRGSVVQS